MNRVLCPLFAAGLLFAGCKSPLLQTASKRSAKPDDKETGSRLDRDPRGDQFGGGLAGMRASARPSGRYPANSDLNAANDALAHGQLAKAKSLYERVLRDDRRNASAHHRLGSIADQQGDYRTANRHYAIALKQRPRDAELLNDVGWSCYLQKRYAESERYLKQAVKIDQKNSRAMYNLGWLYGMQQRPELAYRMFLQGGPRTKADRLMKQLDRALDADRELMLSGGASSGRRRDNLRAPDPNLSRRGTGNINVAIREQMDRARERDLTTRDRENGRYQHYSPSTTRPQSRRADDRYSDVRIVPRDDDSSDANRRYSPDPRSAPARDERIATRSPSSGDLNNEMRRIDGYSERRDPGGRPDSRSTGVRNTGYDDPRRRDARSSGDGRAATDDRSGDYRSHSAARDRNVTLWPPADSGFTNKPARNSYAQRGSVRYADSRRELPNGSGRHQSPRGVDPARRKALLLGHNTGAGGVPFPIPNGSRSERMLPDPDRGRTTRDVRGTVAPTPWRGGARHAGPEDGYSPRRDRDRGYGSRDPGEMGRDFDGPSIHPRTTGARSHSGSPDLSIDPRDQ